MSKLLDFLKSLKATGEEKQLERQAKQGGINTQQEILDVQNQLDQQDQKIDQALSANPFSASKLYEVRIHKQLLQKKLDGLNEIYKELF